MRVTSYPEFAEGQDNGVLLTSQGDVRAGVALTRLSLPAGGDDSVRAFATTSDGTVYVGTGGETAAMDPVQTGPAAQARKPRHRDLCHGAVPAFGAARARARGATAQDGRIFDVGPDGKVQTLPRSRRTTSGPFLRDGGVTYVATGPGGSGPSPTKTPGRGGPGMARRGREKLLDTGAKQFLALARADDGALYVGTADDAVLYRVEPPRDGKEPVARAVHDFAGNEVRAIVARGGVIYVAVNDMQRGDTSAHGAKLVAPPAGSAPGVKPTPPTPPSPPAGSATLDKKGKGALFRIDEAGRVEQLQRRGRRLPRAPCTLDAPATCTRRPRRPAGGAESLRSSRTAPC